MVKVLLINPSKRNRINFDAIPSYPLGLLYLAAVLREAGHKVKIFDLAYLNINYQGLNKLISIYKPDLIGVTAVSVYFNEMKRICNNISKEIPIVVGGVHPSSLPEMTLNETNANYIVIGEGEQTIVELVDLIENGGNIAEIKGLAYKKDGKIIVNEKRPPIKDLDSLPFPAWDLLALKRYNPTSKSGYKGFFDYTEFLPIITTRGCPFKCSFCASTFFWGKSIRARSVSNIIKEIEFNIEHYNVRNFEIWDDNFTYNRKRVINFCMELIKRKISISLYLPNSIRLDTLNRPMINLMKQAGFKAVAISPESGCQEILDIVDKKLDLSIVKNVAKMLRRERITTIAFFMLGLPGETINTAHRTINFAASLPVNGVAFFIFTPLPGSALYEEWLKDKSFSNKILGTNFLGQQNFDNKVISKLTLDQIKKFRVFGLIKFMLKRGNFFRWVNRFDFRHIKPIIISASKNLHFSVD